MINPAISISILIAVITIGFIRLVEVYVQGLHQKAFADEFATKFRAYVKAHDKGTASAEQYEWLIAHVDKIQSDLGIIAKPAYKPPFVNRYIDNYEIILNTLPQIMRDSAHPHDIAYCIECLIRYNSFLQGRLCLARQWLMNPFVWLREGVRLIVLLPINILHWAGLLTHLKTQEIESSPRTTLISGIVMIISLIGSIITIASWQPISQLIGQVFHP